MAIKGQNQNPNTIKPIIIVLVIGIAVIGLGYSLKMYQEKQLALFHEQNKKNNDFLDELNNLQKRDSTTLFELLNSESSFEEKENIEIDEIEEETSITTSFIVKRIPEKESILKSGSLPQRITLFSDEPLDIYSEIQLFYDNEDITITTPILSEDLTSIYIPLDPQLSSGTYEIKYELCTKTKLKCESDSYHFDIE